MEALAKKGAYEITDEMKEKLDDFTGGFATEEETAKEIRRVYEETGYVMDTHTAVASCVSRKYCSDTKDSSKMLIASTASPYKFTRSVMTAIKPEYASMGDFELVDELQRISKVEVPKAIEEIRTAPVLHSRVCEAAGMKDTVMDILQLRRS